MKKMRKIRYTKTQRSRLLSACYHLLVDAYKSLASFCKATLVSKESPIFLNLRLPPWIGAPIPVGVNGSSLCTSELNGHLGYVFCRIFLNRQTAVAHKIIFDLIDQTVVQDTHRHLRWRHLHASSNDTQFDNMILQWTADQHRGQAKGNWSIRRETVYILTVDRTRITFAGPSSSYGTRMGSA